MDGGVSDSACCEGFRLSKPGVPVRSSYRDGGRVRQLVASCPEEVFVFFLFPERLVRRLSAQRVQPGQVRLFYRGQNRRLDQWRS